MRFALYSVTYKIGFPGWPEPILDSVTGFGASIKEEGACTSPLFYFRSQFSHPTSGSSRTLEEFPSRQILVSRFLRGSIEYQKNERPLGGAAARAWGWRVLQSEVSSGVSAVPPRSRAAGRHTGANRSQSLSYSRKP